MPRRRKKEKQKRMDDDLSQDESLLLVLPDETITTILSYFTPPQLATTSLICRRLNELSKEDVLWKPHCQQQSIEGDFKAQYKLECEQTPNPNFFATHPNDPQALRAEIILVGDHINSLQLIHHYVGDNEFFKEGFASSKFVAQYSDTINKKLQLRFTPTMHSVPTLPAEIVHAHCVFLIINLWGPLIAAKNDLERIKESDTPACIAIFGVYDRERTITDKQLSEFAVSNQIGLCEIVNLDQSGETIMAINRIIAALIKATAYLRVSVKDLIEKQPEEPRKNRSRCLMM